MTASTSTRSASPDDAESAGLLDNMAGEGDMERLESTYEKVTDQSSLGSRAFSNSVLSFATACFHIFLPSFLLHSSSPARAKKLHPTAWLDGLRGISALLVVLHHSSILWFPESIHNPWTSSTSSRIIQLPIIRLLISGPPQVAIFFVISGFSLSYKPLRLIRAGHLRECLQALGSSIFRRWPRLFLPSIAVTLVSAVATWAGCFGTEGWGGTWQPVRQPPVKDSLVEQLYDALHSQLRFADPVNVASPATGQGGPLNPYDVNLWTLPVEFAASMVVFATLAAVSGLRKGARMGICVAWMVYVGWVFTYYSVFMFLAGLVLCDLHLERAERKKSGDSEHNGLSLVPPWARRTEARKDMSRLAKAAAITAFLFSLHMLSIPDRGDLSTAPGFVTLGYLVPDGFDTRSFWIPLGAVMLLFTIDISGPFLQILFSHPFSQYLGKISYAFYLIHGPLLWTLGHWLARTTAVWTGRETDAEWASCIALAAAAWWVVAIPLSDFAQRYVDAKCVEAARWMYERLVVREEGKRGEESHRE